MINARKAEQKHKEEANKRADEIRQALQGCEDELAGMKNDVSKLTNQILTVSMPVREVKRFPTMVHVCGAHCIPFTYVPDDLLSPNLLYMSIASK